MGWIANKEWGCSKMGDGHLYFFKGSEYWKYNTKRNKMEDGYPRRISRRWDGLPTRIDAALRWKNGKSYAFKGTEYWRLDDDFGIDKANPSYARDTGFYWFNCPPDDGFGSIPQCNPGDKGSSKKSR